MFKIISSIQTVNQNKKLNCVIFVKKKNKKKQFDVYFLCGSSNKGQPDIKEKTLTSYS